MENQGVGLQKSFSKWRFFLWDLVVSWDGRGSSMHILGVYAGNAGRIPAFVIAGLL